MQEWGNCNFTSKLHSNLSSSVNQMIGVGVASVNLLKIKHNLPMLKQHNPMNKKRIIRNQLTSSLRHNITSELKWGKKIINSYPELPHLKSYRPCTLATNGDVKKALDTRHNYDIREEERTGSVMAERSTRNAVSFYSLRMRSAVNATCRDVRMWRIKCICGISKLGIVLNYFIKSIYGTSKLRIVLNYFLCQSPRVSLSFSSSSSSSGSLSLHSLTLLVLVIILSLSFLCLPVSRDPLCRKPVRRYTSLIM